VRSVPPERCAATTVAQIALPLDVLAVGRPDEAMSALLERMTAKAGNPAFVLDRDDRLAGIVTPADIERAAGLVARRAPPEAASPSDRPHNGATHSRW